VFEGQKCVLLSVSHVFFREPIPSQSTPRDHDSDFDLGSGSEDEEDCDCINITSNASLSSSEDTQEGTDSMSSDPDSSIELIDSSTRVRNLDLDICAPALHVTAKSLKEPLENMSIQDDDLEYLGSLTRYSSELDWAVIEIHNAKIDMTLQETLQRNVSRVHERMSVDSTSCLIKTSHGTISGRVSDVPICMRLPHSTTFEKVCQLTLDQPLDWGDCGAALFLKVALEPHGFIIATSSDKTVAYATIVAQVFADSNVRWRAAVQTSLGILPRSHLAE
jgi:hypothetical protein